MASRYWVGGTGTWDSSATTHWSLTTGGASGASAPTSIDDVIIDTSSGNGNITFTSSANCLGLTVNWTAVKTNSIILSGNFSPSGAVSINGNSSINRILIQSSSAGTSRTFTSNISNTFSNVDFQDIAGAGTASWNLSSITGGSGDCYGNSGITFTTATTQTYTGNTGNQSDASKWTSRVPLPQDNVSFSGCSGGTVTGDMPRAGKNIVWTSATGTPTWSISVSTTIFGSLTLISAMGSLGSSSGLIFAGRGSYSITTAGKSFNSNNMTINCPSGTYTQTDDLVTSYGNININSGSYVTSGYLLEGWGFTLNGSANLDGRNSAIRCKGGGTFWSCSTSGTVQLSGSTIYVFTASASDRTFIGGGKNYGILNYTVTASSGALIVSGSNTFEGINFYDNG